MAEANGNALRGFVAVVSVLVSAASMMALRAQTPRVPQFSARSDLVTLNVTVIGRDRAPVLGLTAADFEIVDGDRARPIVAFTAVDLPTTTARPSRAAVAAAGVANDVANNDNGDGRLVTIMFDHSIPSGWGARTARRIARSIVDRLGPNDYAAIVYSERMLSQGFTRDPVKLARAIDDPSVGTIIGQAKLDATGKWRPEDETGLCKCGLCSLDTIATVADSVAGESNRRKLLFFIGGYLPLNAEAWGSPSSPCQPYLPPAIGRMFRAAQRANLTIYTFDPNGLVAPAQHGAAALIRNGIISTGPGGQSAARDPETLMVAAEQTGGRAIVNTNAPEDRVVDVFEETGSYYLIGVEPAADAVPGSFRALKVRVKRPGAHVLAPRGYYVPDKDAASSGHDEKDPLMTALQGLLPRGAVPMRLGVASFPAPADASMLAITTAIDRETGGPFDLLAAAFDRTGRIVASIRQIVRPRASAGTAATDEVFARLDVPQAGAYHVRVAVRDDVTGRIASVQGSVDVPAFAHDRLSMSGLVVHSARAWERSVTALTDFLQVVPTTRRGFARDEHVTVYAQVGQRTPAAPVRVVAQVFDDQDRALFEHAETIEAAAFKDGPPFYRLDLPLGRLTPGAYALRIEATREADRVMRALRFTVE
jgi:VWFA-related protein